MAFSSDAAFEFKTNFTDRIKHQAVNQPGSTGGDYSSAVEPPSIDDGEFKDKWAVDPDKFKSDWVDSVKSRAPISFEKGGEQYEGSKEHFGHMDYEANKEKGYSDQEIKGYLDKNQHLLRGKNVKGGGGLYDQISGGSSNTTGGRSHYDPSGDAAQQSSRNAAAIIDQDMKGPAEDKFDKNLWGYNAGDAPKYEDHDTNVRNRSAGLDYSVQQDRNYWAAKADKTRGQTFGDVWKMEPPKWQRWEDPEEIKTTWNAGDDKDDDK